jgi:hypothetical protein
MAKGETFSQELDPTEGRIADAMPVIVFIDERSSGHPVMMYVTPTVIVMSPLPSSRAAEPNSR